jgi:predicted PolB exonuclease-like 3'-5' exonuclease
MAAKAPSTDVYYLAFDVESVADAALVSRLRYPGEGLKPAAALARYRGELMEAHGSDFVPYTFQFPISIAVGKISADFHLLDIATLDDPQFRPHVITENFWRGWEKYRRPTLVSFNGRTFDLPLLELAAFRYGISVPSWFNLAAKSFEQYRNRFNMEAHFDLQELLTNFGATRFTGGLNLAANLIGKPGKMDVQGHMVQDMYDAGKLAEINDYCRCDLLDTYFVFLRTRVLCGQLTREEEEKLIDETKEWLTERAAGSKAYAEYLKNWGDWVNPW